MKVKMLIVAAALMAFASLGFAQGGIYAYLDPSVAGFTLTINCDGTGGDITDAEGVIWFYVDNDNNGPDADDPLVPVCGVPCPVGSFNYDHFQMNGEGVAGQAGCFLLDPQNLCNGGNPASPNNKFYIRVKAQRTVGSTLHRVTWTNVQVLTIGTNDNGAADYDCSSPGTWTCVEDDSVLAPPCTPDMITTFSPAWPTLYGVKDMSVCAHVCKDYGHHMICVGPLPREIARPHVFVQSGCSPTNTFCNEVCTAATGWPTGYITPFTWQQREGAWYYCADLVGGANATDGCICIHLDYIENAEIGEVAIVPMNNAVKLTWTTLSETNTAGFAIYRDNDRIATKDAAGSTSGSNYEYVDATVENGHSYVYELRSVDINGAENTMHTFESVTPSFENGVVTEYALHQNYPNPFNPSTKIAFDLVDNNTVSLTIYNATGQVVSTLLSGAQYNKGRHAISFDASNLTSGLYFYTVKIGNEFTATKKMLLVK